jgi:hypothetical protein
LRPYSLAAPFANNAQGKPDDYDGVSITQVTTSGQVLSSPKFWADFGAEFGPWVAKTHDLLDDAKDGPPARDANGPVSETPEPSSDVRAYSTGLSRRIWVVELESCVIRNTVRNENRVD